MSRCCLAGARSTHGEVRVRRAEEQRWRFISSKQADDSLTSSTRFRSSKSEGHGILRTIRERAMQSSSIPRWQPRAAARLISDQAREVTACATMLQQHRQLRSRQIASAGTYFYWSELVIPTAPSILAALESSTHAGAAPCGRRRRLRESWCPSTLVVRSNDSDAVISTGLPSWRAARRPPSLLPELTRAP